MKTILNVVYSFDDGYAQHAGVSILSLLENNRDIDEINVYIIDNSIEKINKERLNSIIEHFRRTITYLDLYELTKDLCVNTQFNRSAYGRIFISEVLSLDEILYIDSDTVINHSLKELLEIDMTNYLVAGVQDTVNPYYLYMIDLNSCSRYINDGGIIILNLALWRKKKIMQQCVDFIVKFDGNPPHNDQGTINYVCRNAIKILPANYNVMNPMFNFSSKQIQDLFKMKKYYSQQEVNDAISNPVVIHYTDEFFNRPWFINCTHPLKQTYLDYLKKSPWADNELKKRKLSRNCRTQNWIYKNSPYFIYKLMIRFIEYHHMYRI